MSGIQADPSPEERNGTSIDARPHGLVSTAGSPRLSKQFFDSAVDTLASSISQSAVVNNLMASILK